jgi:hypothetical protein
MHAHGTAVEPDLDRTVGVGSICRPGELVQPFDRRRRRVPVRIAGARGHDGHLRMHGLQERRGARSSRTVMGHLEEIDLGDAPREQLRINTLLDVAGKQEPVPGRPHRAARSRRC